MTTKYNPVGAMFDAQQTMIEGSQRAFESNLRLQRTAAETFLGSFEATKTVQKSGARLSRRTIHATIDGVEAGLPADVVAELRAVVDEQFEAFDQVHDEVWAAVEEGYREVLDSHEELTEAQRSLVDDAVESALEINKDAAEATEDAVGRVEQFTEEATEVDIESGN